MRCLLSRPQLILLKKERLQLDWGSKPRGGQVAETGEAGLATELQGAPAPPRIKRAQDLKRAQDSGPAAVPGRKADQGARKEKLGKFRLLWESLKC